MESTDSGTPLDAIWRELSPHLDSAMASLGQTERYAVVLRYFQNKSMAEVGRLLGLEENTAQKRVGRAVEKLRKFFTKKGMVLSASVIATVVSANSVQAAPAGLSKIISSVAVAKGAAAGTSTLTLVKGALKFMAWAKAKTAVFVSVGILLAASTTVMVNESLTYREPSYQGRSLSEWLPDVVPDQFGPPQVRQAKAAEAIRQMGTKTLPFLLNDLTFDPKLHHYRLHYLKPETGSADQRNSQATWAFDALGPLAKPAIPELDQLLEQNPGYVPGALVGIGRDALPDVFRALTNGSFFVRDNTAAYLANAIYAGRITPEEARPVLPLAVDDLSDSDTNPTFRANTHWHGASLLGAIRLEPDLSVPALITDLQDTQNTVAVQCAQALGRFGDNGKAAIPALVRAAGSTNAELGSEAVASLSLIDSNAVLRFVFDKALTLITNQDVAVRIQVIQALGRVGPAAHEAVTALVTRMTDSEYVVRMLAAESLGMIAQHPTESVPALRQGLRDSNQVVQSASIKALGKFGPTASDAVNDLLGVAKMDPQLKGNVRIALEQIDSKSAANLR